MFGCFLRIFARIGLSSRFSALHLSLNVAALKPLFKLDYLLLARRTHRAPRSPGVVEVAVELIAYEHIPILFAGVEIGVSLPF